MEITLFSPNPHGIISAIPSKSYAHRALICAALSDGVTEILCSRSSRDIDATVSCLRSLGAEIDCSDAGFTVYPVKNVPEFAILHPGESGSTLRFMLPTAAVLGTECEFVTEGRLSSRPLSPLSDELERHGAKVRLNPVRISGKIGAGEYCLDGSVSSQFTTGLMLALPYLGEDSTVVLSGKVESKPYITLTERVLEKFGIMVTEEDNAFSVSGRYHSPSRIKVEGDWSNAAFMLSLGALTDGITVTGLDLGSSQGDKKIVDILRNFGAQVSENEDSVTVKKSPLHGITVDAADIPDLVPIVSVVAMAASGTTVIKNCGRLRLKESDRIESVCTMITSLGGDISVCGDDITVHGGTVQKSDVTVNSYNDHRIVMAAAVGSVLCSSPVTIDGCEAVAKSYPGFFDDFGKLCMN